MSVVLPGSTIGILGGGQLGRMTAMAARAMGYHLHTLDPDPSCAARFVVERSTAMSKVWFGDNPDSFHHETPVDEELGLFAYDPGVVPV